MLWAKIAFSLSLVGWTWCEETRTDIASPSLDTFTEELFASPLRSGHVYLNFKFTVSTPLKSRYAHVDFFPKAVIDAVQTHHVQEMHVRLTQGVFRHQKWGYPLLSAPSGGEVWAWFDEDTPSVPDSWRGLTNSLAGMVCATFNEIKAHNSITPKWSFRLEGLHNAAAVNTSLLRYSMLANENLCTENLTPWKKLLPCYDRAGFGKLLNAIKLLSSHYFSMALDVKPVCANPECSEKLLQLSVSATTVMLPASIQDAEKQSWSLRELLETTLDSGCPVASSSLIYVNQSMKGQNMIFWPSPSYYTTAHNEDIAVYDVSDDKIWTKSRDLGGRTSHRIDYTAAGSPVLTSHRFVSGVGQQSGGIRCLIENHNPDKSVTISYLEIIPWFLRVYFHTIHLTDGNGNAITIKQKNFQLGRDHQLPHHIELIFTIPASSTVEFGVDFDYTLLNWSEYPPDANRGFTLPPAVINAKLDDCDDFQFPRNFTSLGSTESSCFLRLYTEPLLVTLPTPDFSMPYNVICMTSTVVALAFGPIHAITTKRFVLRDPLKGGGGLKALGLKGRELLLKIRRKPILFVPIFLVLSVGYLLAMTYWEHVMAAVDWIHANARM